MFSSPEKTSICWFTLWDTANELTTCCVKLRGMFLTSKGNQKTKAKKGMFEVNILNCFFYEKSVFVLIWEAPCHIRPTRWLPLLKKKILWLLTFWFYAPRRDRSNYTLLEMMQNIYLFFVLAQLSCSVRNLPRNIWQAFCINKAVKIFKTFKWMVRTISYIQNSTTNLNSYSAITSKIS